MAAKKAKKAAKKKTKTGLKDRLVQNYGLHWRWDYVHTGGGQGNKGTLWGYRKGAKTKHVDFRDQRGIYALYADYTFVYAGQVDKRGLLKRLIEHTGDDLAERWNRFSFFGTRRVLDSYKLGKIKDSAKAKTSTVINQLEAFLIYVSGPSLNNNRGKWSDASRYHQVRDKRLGDTPDERLVKLQELLKDVPWKKLTTMLNKKPKKKKG